jgi:beta-lactamase class D
MKIKYDTPIEVTEKQCKRIRKKFGMLIAWRKDNDNKYWIKLWAMEYRDELVKELKI